MNANDLVQLFPMAVLAVALLVATWVVANALHIPRRLR
jgi:hypothetical protein